MNKQIINVPKGIRFISEWSDFSLPETPTIINKTITGCGFTEYCIRNNQNVILCSPRKILLENKEEQHLGEMLYVRNELDKVLDIDKDLSSGKPDLKALSQGEKDMSDSEKEALKSAIDSMHMEVRNYYMICQKKQEPCNLASTYDSFKHLRDALGDRIKDFYVVVDEFQSIFTDSRFKSSTEMEFLNFLQGIDRLCFVSATPMMDKYLDMLDEFKDLPYIELDWKAEDPGRVINPQLSVRPCQNIVKVACDIIQSYLDSNFQKYTYTDDSGVFQEIESKEVVIYVNSVKNICDIIKKSGLTYENTNILCARTPDNEKKIRKAFGLKRSQAGGIGSVPVYGQPRKMFTLCTRTVYLGSDFYSDNARTVILSDANIDCLAVDITLDLPQILGRQRLLENPWKNRAELYFKVLSKGKKLTAEDFINKINEKRENSESLLRSYSNAEERDKHVLAKKYQKSTKADNYKDDYVAVNTHGGKDLFPVFNNLVMVSEFRAFEIQQLDYRDRFTVFNTIRENGNEFSDEIELFLKKFEDFGQFTDKMKLLCESGFLGRDLEDALNCIPIIFKNYYLTLGPEKIRNMQYKKYALDAEYERQKNNQNNNSSLSELIYSTFKVGEKYLKSDIKNILRDIYFKAKIESAPKANELENYFETRKFQATNKITGKRDNGYEILSVKL